MKKIAEYSNISRVDLINDMLLVSKRDSGFYRINDSGEEALLDEKIDFFTGFGGNILCIQENRAMFYFDTRLKEKRTYIPGSFWPLSLKKGIGEFLIKEGNGKKTNYRVNGNLDLKPCVVYESQYLFNNIIVNTLGPEIFAFNMDSGKELWRHDISGIDTTEWSSKYGNGSNSLDGSLFSWRDLIMIPLASGDLTAVHGLNGKMVWIAEKPHSAVFNCICENIIYAMNNVTDTVYCIDAETGKILKQEDFTVSIRQIYKDGFDGTLIVWEDKLFIRSFKDGLLAIINRHTLELLEIIELPRVFMGIDPGNIIWHHNRLYILDPISHVLHICQ